MSTRARWITGCAAAAVALAVASVLLSRGGPAQEPPFAGTAVTHPDPAWDQLFQTYGDSSDAWSGGDGAQSLLLPDGGTVWFFADTYLGPTGTLATRSPLTTGLAHNSAVLYRDGQLGPTYAVPPGLGGYSGTADYTWVTPPPPYPASRYELINGDQVLDHGTVYKFYQLADRDLHPDDFAYKLVGTVIETFSVNPATDALTPAGGTPLGVRDTLGSDPVIWGVATVVSYGYIYIYGVKPYNGGGAPNSLYLARVPVGGLAAGDAWQYYDAAPGCPASSSAWGSDPGSATALRAGVSAGFSVTDVNGTYVLLTSGPSSDAVAYYAQCPTGFSPGSPRYRVYQPRLPAGWISYEYRIVPQFSSGRTVLVCYSTNAIRPEENFANVTIYRPRFLDVTLPGIRGPVGHVTEPLLGAHMTSPFGVVDELNCYFDSPAEPNNVHLEAWLPGQLCEKRLRAAVAATLAETPRARIRRAAGGWWLTRYSWELPAETDVDPLIVTACRDEDELGAVRARFLAAAPALGHSPLFRLLLARGPEYDSLILNAHHAAFDGRSCLLLLRLIAGQYRKQAPDAGSGGRPSAPIPGRAALSSRRTVRIASQHAHDRAPGYGVCLLGWSDVPAVSQPHATINDLLIAALIQTIARWNGARNRPAGRVRITMPVDIRPPGGEAGLGNLSRLCTVTVDPASTADLTAAVSGQTTWAKAHPGPPVSPMLAAAARAPVPVPVKRRLVRLALRSLGSLACDTSLLSNLGAVTDPPWFESLSPTRMWFSTSAHMPRGLSVGAVTVNGRLQLCFRYRNALFDESAARDFAAEYAVALSELAGG
jgi:NRPS condensation-like uncharacterized protein